uniref:NADH-ubiquinone oxidoreductase chain 4 n=1 Tax=Gynaikothrips ficorum TaxID=59752 RepID=A0A7M1LDG7_GYNFI|nr:NADH dehydrogenase subunit 4 [Gynaikothrips ficorum]QOQ85871.1 NADH dehydrogenase subunit 4 [Gynaikothrips ficorum]
MTYLFLIHPYMKFWKLSLIMILKSFLFMKFSINLFFSNLTMMMGCDILSLFMILLVIFIISLSILSSKNIFKLNYFFFLILVLMKFLIFLFSTSNFLFFYVFFEFSLIPMMLIILGWGMKIERMQAGMYFFFYTMFSSLPLLYNLIFYFYFSSSNYMFLNNNIILKNFFLTFFFTFAFLVKMPIFLFHLWLPKAHVEAPVSGSMILAGVLLKLGGYGLMRMMIIMLENIYMYSNFLISFSLWGGLIISFSCLNQIDLKMIVAFSSISHMSLLISGIFSMNKLGLYGSFLIMISHGLTSSGLFMLVNIFYERTHSRSLILNKGMMNISPNLSLMSFLIISAGMASPPSINLLSEFILSYSILYMYLYFMILMFFMLLISVIYSMYMYSFNQHGKLFKGMYFFKCIYMVEYLNIFLHWFLANFFILKSEFLILFY